MASPSLNFLGAPVSIALEDMGDRAIVERWGPDGPEADVMFKCKWSDRYLVIKYLRGGVIGSGRTVTYLAPASYPSSPNLKCTSIGELRGIKPRTLDSGWVEYEYAIVPAHFSTPTWDAIGTTDSMNSDPSHAPMTTTRFRGSPEILTPPGGSYYYTSGTDSGKPVLDSTVGIVRSRVEISMTRHMIPFPLMDKLMFDVGCINDTTMVFADRTFPRGTVLFAAFDSDPVAEPSTGQKCWDYTFSFVANYSKDWNYFLDPHGEWVPINSKADGTGDPPFEYEDLSYLLSDTF